MPNNNKNQIRSCESLKTVNNTATLNGRIQMTEEVCPQTRLTMMIGALNIVRMAIDDEDIKLMLTNVLRAGGWFVDDDD